MRTRGFVLLVFLVSLSGLSLAGCSRSESSSPAASASASAAQASALVTCSKVAMAIAEGNLTTAETDLANLSDIQCQPDLAAVITAQRAEAATLATSALAPGITDRASVARAALALDSQNAIALALVSQLPDAEPSDIPGVMATPSPVAAVADEPTPRETITTAATTSSAPLIAGSIALLTGALLGRFLPFPWLLKLRRGRRVLGISALVSGAYVFLAVYAWPVLSAPDWGDVGGPAASLARWIFGREHTREPFIWLLAAIAGVLVMFYLRSAAASVVKVMGAGLTGGTSFMEDYTYHLNPRRSLVLGAHMLEICPSRSRVGQTSRPTSERHWIRSPTRWSKLWWRCGGSRPPVSATRSASNSSARVPSVGPWSGSSGAPDCSTTGR